MDTDTFNSFEAHMLRIGALVTGCSASMHVDVAPDFREDLLARIGEPVWAAYPLMEDATTRSIIFPFKRHLPPANALPAAVATPPAYNFTSFGRHWTARIEASSSRTRERHEAVLRLASTQGANPHELMARFDALRGMFRQWAALPAWSNCTVEVEYVVNRAALGLQCVSWLDLIHEHSAKEEPTGTLEYGVIMKNRILDMGRRTMMFWQKGFTKLGPPPRAADEEYVFVLNTSAQCNLRYNSNGVVDEDGVIDKRVDTVFDTAVRMAANYFTPRLLEHVEKHTALLRANARESLLPS